MGQPWHVSQGVPMECSEQVTSGSSNSIVRALSSAQWWPCILQYKITTVPELRANTLGIIPLALACAAFILRCPCCGVQPKHASFPAAALSRLYRSRRVEAIDDCGVASSMYTSPESSSLTHTRHAIHNPNIHSKGQAAARLAPRSSVLRVAQRLC